MYLPIKFKPAHESQLDLMRGFPFATVITLEDTTPVVNHLPILTEIRGDEIVLIGHMARANPQWKQFAESEVTVLFQGPHTYVTPSWYPDSLNVPTWNYAVVHATGRATLVETVEGIESILHKTVATFEAGEPKPWKYELPEEFRQGLIRAIVGFEIRVHRLEGKFKLSQNRTPDDREGVLRGLATRKDEMSLKILELMRKNS